MANVDLKKGDTVKLDGMIYTIKSVNHNEIKVARDGNPRCSERTFRVDAYLDGMIKMEKINKESTDKKKEFAKNAKKENEVVPNKRTPNLADLNDHLFTALARLNDEKLSGDALQAEINRAKMVASIADQVIQNGELMLKTKLAKDRANSPDFTIPERLGTEK